MLKKVVLIGITEMGHVTTRTLVPDLALIELVYHLFEDGGEYRTDIGEFHIRAWRGDKDRYVEREDA